MTSDGHLSVGPTFSGVGGIDLAFESTGRFRTEWMSEVDPHASQVLAAHWPDVPNHGDIHAIRDVPERTDVIVGGFPCQDYSMAGSRSGLAGDRGAVWWDLHRLIADGRPTWFVGENVPGLVTANGGRDFRTIIRSLVDLGYGVSWRVLDAQWFGLAQRRKRVVIVGHSGGRPRPAVLALPQSVSGDSRPSRTTGPTDGSTRPVGGGARGPSGLVSSAGQDTVGTITTHWGPKNYSNAQEVFQGSIMAYDSYSHVTDPNVSYSLSTDSFHQRNLVAYSLQPNDRLGGPGALRAVETDIAATVGTQHGHSDRGTRVVQDKLVRRVTPLEAERLQGFPDGWTEGQSVTQRFKQMGNAVAVPVFAYVADNLWKDHTNGD